MTETLLAVVFSTLTITGVWNCAQKGMIFGVPAAWLESKLPKWISRPLFLCPACMASCWGSLVFFLVLRGEIMYWPLFVLAVSGLAHITFTHLYEKP